MSEIVVEEEPDPLPLREYVGNPQMPVAYDSLLSNYYVGEAELSITPEIRQQEEYDLRLLTEYADRILFQGGDMTITSGSAQLRRRHFEDGSDFYFLVDGTYCRSWIKGGKRVNWCVEELRHEPAKDVFLYLKRTFDEVEMTSSSRGTLLGRKVLAKLLR